MSDNSELKMSKLPTPMKPDISEKTYYVKDAEGDLVVGKIDNPNDPSDPLIGQKIKLEQIDYDDYGSVVKKWGNQEIKDKKMDEFVNTSYNQTQKEILSELAAFDKQDAQILIKKLDEAFINKDWETYDRLLIENGINSNLSIKAKAYSNTKTYKTVNEYGEEIEIPIVYQNQLFSTDTTIDQLMFEDNPEALEKLTPSERETLKKMKNTGIPMNAANFPGTYKSIDLSTKKTPFTPVMILEALREILGKDEAEKFLEGKPSKEEIQRVTRLVLEMIQRPPLTTIMSQCVKECRQMIANSYASKFIESMNHLKGTPEYELNIRPFKEHAEKLLKDDTELKKFMDSFFIKGRMIGDPDIKLPYDKYDIPVLNFYFEKYDDFTNDVKDLENNALLFDENYRAITRTNVKIRKVVLETFELIGLDFIEVFTGYLKKKNSKAQEIIPDDSGVIEETTLRKGVTVIIDDEDEIW